MRIIAGDWRSRKLVAPPGSATRPTADRAREMLFSMLASRLGSFEGLRVADLYAGSGALGFEALSRGATSCLFVDRDLGAQKAIRANAENLGCGDRIQVRATLPVPSGRFDVIFADPPYGSGEADRTLAAVAAQDMLGPGGWLALETARGDMLDTNVFVLAAERRSGRALIRLLRPIPSSPTPS